MQVEPWIFLALLFFIAIAPGCMSLTQDGLALLEFKRRIQADPHKVMRQWNSKDKSPCQWPGVSCSQGRVISLNLNNFSLHGTLGPEFGRIRSLKILVLGNNNLYGAIPKQLGDLEKLEYLDLGHNEFEGKIPLELGNALSLTKLYLENNHLQGIIPSELGNLFLLYELRLDRNKLTGAIPINDRVVASSAKNKTVNLKNIYRESSSSRGLCRLMNLTTGDFSYNYLQGKIPSCLLYLPRLSFGWNCFNDMNKVLYQRPQWQCGGHKILHPSSAKNKAPITHHSHWRKGLQSAAVAGVFILVLIGIIIFFHYNHRTATVSPWRTNMSGLLQKTFVTGVPAISRTELETACEDFSNIIGASSDSIIYKGNLPDGTEIAVTSIKASATSWTRKSEVHFRFKVDNLARMNHKNVVKLLAYCAEDDPFTRMLVFEYIPNGSLFDLLHNGESEHVDWNARMRIVMGVAYGLQYMHHELKPPAAYTTLDSNSVYLTEDYAAKLADFEMWKVAFVKRDKNSSSSICTKAISQDDLDDSGRTDHDFGANIFGFGVLLLELITGRLPYSKEQGSLVDWASEYLNTPEVIAYMVDPAMRFFSYKQLEALCEIARLCTNSDSLNRPKMNQITGMLETALGISSESAGPKSSPLLWAELAILTQI